MSRTCDVEYPQSPDDCAFPLVETIVALHMEAIGSADCWSITRTEKMADWVEGRVGEHWRETKGDECARAFDNAVRQMGIAAVVEARNWIERVRKLA